MTKRPLIFISTDNAPTFCRNQCNNAECSKHQSRGFQHAGMCKFTLLKDTTDCEGYVSKRAKKTESKV